MRLIILFTDLFGCQLLLIVRLQNAMACTDEGYLESYASCHVSVSTELVAKRVLLGLSSPTTL